MRNRVATCVLFLGVAGSAQLLAARPAHADCSSTSCTSVRVTRLYVNDASQGTPAGHINVATDGDESQLSCQPHSGVYLAIAQNEPNKEMMYSTLLAALLSGKTVSLRADTNGGAFSNCQIRYVWIDE